MIDYKPLIAQLGAYTSIAIAFMVLNKYLAYTLAYISVFVVRLS